MQIKTVNKNGKEMVCLISDENPEQSMVISWNEFWQICRYGSKIDARNEIDVHLSDCEKIRGVNASTIQSDDRLMDEIADQLISDRTDNESGDDVYDAISEVLMKNPVIKK